MVAGKDKTSLDAIDHVAISVKDIGVAVKWYTQEFNCAVDYQDETWAYLRFENIRLALVIPGQHPPHIALAVGNAGQYGQLKTHRDGTKSVYVKDPAGNTVELVECESPVANKSDH